jgi:hypothetical protein
MESAFAVIREVDAWLAPFRRFWSRLVDALEQHRPWLHIDGRCGLAHLLTYFFWRRQRAGSRLGSERS